MKSLIIGAGQVGTALRTVLSPFYDVQIRDIEDVDVKDVDVLHICYPDHEGFEVTTKKYIDQYKPNLTIVHSSVRVGITKKCGSDVVYSPTRGRHPKLAEEMPLFTKFFACEDIHKALQASHVFVKCGFKCLCLNNPDELEFFKTISNVHMGLEVAWRQEVERMMLSLGINTGNYDIWEKSYRDGCLEAKDYNLIRSIMRPDPIGGHCILPCIDLLKESYDSKFLDLIVESNERVKNDRLVSK